jgi:hypothetical protein
MHSDAKFLQWRKEFASHLSGARLQRLAYRKREGSRTDHAHCAACWTRIAGLDWPDAQHEGYTTCDDYKHGDIDRTCQQPPFSVSFHAEDIGDRRNSIGFRSRPQADALAADLRPSATNFVERALAWIGHLPDGRRRP